MDIEKLKEKLKSINRKELSEEEAKRVIGESTPLELSLAEQQLLEEGITEAKLKEFCSLHLKTMEDSVKELKNRLPESHPIHTFISEHEEIIKVLDRLDGLIEPLKRGLNKEEKKEIKHLAEHLVEAEKHHEREEKVIFPRLEEKGITGPPRIMRMEHDELRPQKKRLREITDNPEENKQEIIQIINLLSYKLKDHIFKENNILYPAALKELEDWERIKEEADLIGYCCFTPQESVT